MIRRVEEAAAIVRAAGYGLSRPDENAARARLLYVYTRVVRAQALREEQAREDDAQQRQAEAQAREAGEIERTCVTIQAAIDRALRDAAGRHTSELDALRAQTAEIEATAAQLKRATPLALTTRVGHVYVISNIGSFGRGVFKIGMSHHKDPQERVDELGAASVPFPFDVHMMIKCDDARTARSGSAPYVSVPKRKPREPSQRVLPKSPSRRSRPRSESTTAKSSTSQNRQHSSIETVSKLRTLNSK